jgi:hypothetical protein
MYITDKTKKYFFHNVYGDAQDLINTVPDDVILIPYGWSEDIEEYRNKVLDSLDRAVSTLPSVIFWGKDYTTTDSKGVEYFHPAKWEEVRVETLEKPWNWDDVNACIEAFMDKPEDGVPGGLLA